MKASGFPLHTYTLWRDASNTDTTIAYNAMMRTNLTKVKASKVWQYLFSTDITIMHNIK